MADLIKSESAKMGDEDPLKPKTSILADLISQALDPTALVGIKRPIESDSGYVNLSATSKFIKFLSQN